MITGGAAAVATLVRCHAGAYAGAMARPRVSAGSQSWTVTPRCLSSPTRSDTSGLRWRPDHSDLSFGVVGRAHQQQRPPTIRLAVVPARSQPPRRDRVARERHLDARSIPCGVDLGRLLCWQRGAELPRQLAFEDLDRCVRHSGSILAPATTLASCDPYFALAPVWPQLLSDLTATPSATADAKTPIRYEIDWRECVGVEPTQDYDVAPQRF